jgi:hypothetical protein
MALDKRPHEIVHLEISMKLYKSFKDDNFKADSKIRPKILTDSISFNYKTHGNGYAWNADWEQEQKRKLNLPTTGLHVLSASERKLYTVAVDAGKITKFKSNEYPFTRLRVPTIITNNSDKTLKYYSMTCSWWEFYHVDNKDLGVDLGACDNNFPILVIIPPHSSHTDIVSFISDKNGLNKPQFFKIGLNINICEEKGLFDLYDEELRIYNIVWSNEVKFIAK